MDIHRYALQYHYGCDFRKIDRSYGYQAIDQYFREGNTRRI